jgi:hypothetical protein
MVEYRFRMQQKSVIKMWPYTLHVHSAQVVPVLPFALFTYAGDIQIEISPKLKYAGVHTF